MSIALIGNSQSDKFSIEFKDLPLATVLNLVSQKTGYNFSYNSDILPLGSKFTMNEAGIGIEQFLNKLLAGTGLQHQLFEDQIIIKTMVLNVPISKELTTFTINGRVIDEFSEPIPSVNVFLSGTNMGNVTDLQGYYTIDRVPFGSYEVIFSHLAYTLSGQETEFFKTGVVTINGHLTTRINVLDSVEVISRRLIGPEERAKFMKIFENEFLGRSENSRNCKILNPEVLDFIYDPKGDHLEVFALEPVKILNEHLGYEITYVFELFQKVGNHVNFYGKARFDNLKPENRQEEKHWIRNRQMAYRGSFLHFRRSLMADNLRKDQFRIALIPTNELDEVINTPLQEVTSASLLKPRSDQGYNLNFDGFLQVSYRRKPDESYKDQFFDRIGSNTQRSMLKLNGQTVILKQNGRMEYPGLATFGYWYWERIADMLPENYDPEIDTL